MTRPELDVLLDEYGITREDVDNEEGSDWTDNVIPTEVLVAMIAWRYVELGKAEYRIAEDGEVEFRYTG